jgi:hypothetical protein
MSNKISRKNNLDKLNIENLFSIRTNNKRFTNGKLDINTLFKRKVQTEEDVEFNSEVLLDSINKKREKMKEVHINLYKNCCDKIITANSSGVTDIIYEIPITIPECIGFDSFNCLKYIQNKLYDNCITSLIITQNKIFLSWVNIEKKLSNKHINDDNNKNSN